MKILKSQKLWTKNLDFFSLPNERQEISLGTFKNYILEEGELTDYSDYTIRSSFFNMKLNDNENYGSNFQSKMIPKEFDSILLINNEDTWIEEEKINSIKSD